MNERVMLAVVSSLVQPYLRAHPIDSRISVQASRNAYEADSFADGVHDRIINAEYVTATLSRRGPWEWTLEVAGAHELHDAWGDKDAVQDHLLNRFVRGYYRF